MVCHAIGRCRICARQHKMPIFGSEENQHALIEIVNLRLIVLNTVCVDCIEKFERAVKRKDLRAGYESSAYIPEDTTLHLYHNNSMEKYDETAVRPTMHFYVETDENKNGKSAPSQENERLSPRKNLNSSEKTVTHQTQKEQVTTLQTSSSYGKTKNPEISTNARAKSRVQCQLCCDYCEKVFSHRGDLKRHHRKHTGEKPYECVECLKKFSQLSNLSRHRLVHSGERPFACAQCGQGYSRKGRLINHIGRELCRRNSRRSCKFGADMDKIKQCN